jgi:hypothetical protein
MVTANTDPRPGHDRTATQQHGIAVDNGRASDHGQLQTLPFGEAK